MKRIVCLMLATLLGLSMNALANQERRIGPTEKTVNAMMSADVKLSLDRPDTKQSLVAPGIRMTYAPKAWNTLLSENFESGAIPGTWTVIDNNGDNYMWAIDVVMPTGANPPNSGTYFVVYNDDVAGEFAPPGIEELITPAMYVDGYDSLYIRYDFAMQDYNFAGDLNTNIRTFTGGSWGSWTLLINHTADLVSSDSLNLTSYLPADSVQIEFVFDDGSAWGWGAGIDNVVVGGNLTPRAHDLKLQSIDQPATAIIPADVAFFPSWTIKNVGTNPESDFSIQYIITDSTGAEVYNQLGVLGTPDTLRPDTTWVSFFGTSFTPDSFMQYQALVYVDLAADEQRSNDTLRFNFRTYDRDVGATAIVVPAGGYVHKDSTIAPQATYHNYATEPATFDACFQIDFGGGPVYLETIAVTDLAPGADTTITFADWSAPHDMGSHQVYAYTCQYLDLNPANDTTGKTITTTPIWQYVANVPNGGGAYTRWSYNGSCVSNNLLWLVAGRRDAGWAVLNNVGTYNPATNTWNDTRPVVNQPRVYLTAAGNDQYVFALGGRNSSATVVYRAVERLASPDGLTWSYVDSLPAGRTMGTAVCDNQYLYYLGGSSDASGATQTTTLWRYDIAGNSWDQTLAQIPATMYAADAVLLNGKIYILGDATNNTTYVYDIAGDSWTSVSNGLMPAASMYEAVAMYGKIWRIGGTVGGSSTNAVWELDTLAGTWTDISKPMLQTRISFGAGFINGTVVSAGGVAFPGFTPTMTAEAIDISWMGVEGKPATVTAPGTFALYGNYPNPFRSATKIQYQLPKAGRVNLSVYSVTGQLVKTLVCGTQPAGRHSMNWNGKDNGGRAVSSGIYFYRLSANGSNATGKLVMVR